MTDTPPTFGIERVGASYVLRPGGYALIGDGRQRIAVVHTDAGLHLPGGGQDGNESPAEAALREAGEEAGLLIAIHALVGVADQLVYARAQGIHYRKRETVFLATVAGANPSALQPGHRLEWLSPRLACKQLREEAQRWAVGIAMPARLALPDRPDPDPDPGHRAKHR
jgi:8-oxo-dGTP diphosphatase